MAPVRALSALAVLAGITGAAAAPTPGYNYNMGGQDWGAGYTYSNAACVPGPSTKQSPINIADSIVTYATTPLPNISVSYGQAASWVLEVQRNYLEVANIDTQTTNGSLATANAFTDGITIGGTLLPLNQFHFHTPSEHTINGQHYPLEMHMVHKLFKASASNSTIVPANTAGAVLSQAAVIGIMFKYSDDGSDGPFLAKLMTAITNIAPRVVTQANSVNSTTETDSDASAAQFNLMTDIFGASAAGLSKYYTYMGSLTTPGCSENITWFNMAIPLTASPAQILNFTYLLSLEQKVYEGPRNGVSRGGDNRLVQPLNNRTVSASWSAGPPVVITQYASLQITSSAFTSALQTTFKSTIATGASVPASAVAITAITDIDIPAGRRHLLTAGISVTYTVTVATPAAATAARTALTAFTSAPAGGVSPFSAALAANTQGAIAGATVTTTNPVASAAPVRAAAVLISVMAAAFALAF